MSISAAEALLSKELPVPLVAPASSAAVLLLPLLLAVAFTPAAVLVDVLMLVTLVAMLLLVVLFIVAGSDEGGVGGPLKADTKVALLKGELLLAGALAWLLMVLELLLLPLPLPLLGFCSGMLSVSLSPPCFYFMCFKRLQSQANIKHIDNEHTTARAHTHTHTHTQNTKCTQRM